MTKRHRVFLGLAVVFANLGITSVAHAGDEEAGRGSCSSCLNDQSAWYNCCPSCNRAMGDTCNCTKDGDCGKAE